MLPLDSDLVDKLEIADVVLEEVETQRNLIPPEPWLDQVKANHAAVAEWVKTQLLSGHFNSAGQEVSARKVGHGIRPVSILGVSERIVYRALSKFILSGQDLPERSAAEYREFIHGPIGYAFGHLSGSVVKISDSRIDYVVEADITAFYQYIDHDLLKQELLMQTGHIDAVDRLVEFLTEITGKRFGVPQLIDASDWLSEMYARILERDLLRKGLQIWRFNDDFRIGCENYADALRSLEELSSAARAVGLVVGDHKTFTRRFFRYMLTYTGISVDETAAEFDPQDVEAAVTEYSQLDGDESITAALATLGRLDAGSSSEDRLDLKNLSREDHKDLRRAFNALTKYVDASGLKWVKRLFQFATPLTPHLIKYIIAIHDLDAEKAASAWAELRPESQSDWQSLWLVHAAFRTDVAKDNQPAIEWISEQARGRRHESLRAEAYLTLAKLHRVEFDELDFGLRNAPDALAPWYVLAMKETVASPKPPTAKQIEAIKQSSPLFSILLK